VEGTQNILHAANDIGAFVITLSTGSVFAGSARKKHDTTVPQFSESTKVVLAPDRMSWYGYTKAEAESFITNESPMRHAIIRLSHPVGPEESLCHHDYLHTLTHLFKTKTLFPLFSDQQFAITYLPDLMKLLTFLIQTNRPGIYHPVSPDTTTPYDLVSYTLQQSNMRVSDLKTIPLATFLSTHRTPLRFDPSIHLMNNETEKITNIHFLPWKAMVENIL
jgi:dTDP-4-dehydrorhamnose reductase